MNWISQIISFSIILGVFLGVLIWFQNSQSRKRNRFFAVFIVLIVLQIWKDLLRDYGADNIRIDLYLIAQGTSFFIGPTLFFYFKVMIQGYSDRVGQIVKHYIPGLIYIPLVWIAQRTLPTSTHFVESITPALASLLVYGILLGQLLHIFHYLRSSFRLIRSHASDNGMAEVAKSTRLIWLRSLLIGVVIFISVVVLPHLFLTAYSPVDRLQTWRLTYLLLLSGVINFLAIRAFNHPDITYGLPNFKYQNSGLDTTASENLKSRLEQIMIDKRPYLQSDLKLEDLATLISTKPAHLSQIMNHYFDQSFPEFINQYRIAEAKRILEHDYDKHYSMYEVAIDAGFNSKATFNRVFKSNTGHTPTEYIKHHGKDAQAVD